MATLLSPTRFCDRADPASGWATAHEYRLRIRAYNRYRMGDLTLPFVALTESFRRLSNLLGGG